MDRRRFLELAGVGSGFFAGCSGGPADESPTGTTTEPPESSPTGTPRSTDSPEPTATPRENPDTLFVAPDGAASNPGTEDAPLDSVHEGLQRARPGETIQVAPGEYDEGERFDKPVETVRDGEPGAPITITGPPAAVLRPSLRIRHSHVHLTGLTIEGLVDPDSPDDPDAYVHIPSPDAYPVSIRPFHDSDEYLEDVVCAPHGVGYGAIALVRVQRTAGLEIGPLKVTGMAGASWILPDTPDKHAGEIIYLGAPQGIVYEDFYPWYGLDQTRNVHIHHVDNSEGHPHSELVDAKLGTSDVLVEYCTDGGGAQSNDPYPGSAVGLRSHEATLRWCDLRGGDGYGVKITDPVEWLERQDDPAIDPDSYAGNAVYGNVVEGFAETALETHTRPEEQQVLCGNEFPDATDPTGTRACPAEVPEGDGVGHLGGDSPWA